VRDSEPSLITGERDLPNHLKGENEDSDAKPGKRADTDDYALSEAVNVLKGLALARKPAPVTGNAAAPKKSG